MDDGFDWLDTLPDDLQRQIWHLMECVAEGRHGQVDAIVPGLVARARAEERPWVEIFARNFALRSQVLHREDIRDGLGPAIDLLDRAHAPDTVACPQTICTAHAVCAAYGIKDPTGYIDERLKVSTETLSRTDPRRVCWLCISNEHADALLDAGRPDDALAFLAEQTRVRIAAGGQVDPDDFGLRETAAHLAAGRLDAAEKALADAWTDARGGSWHRTWRQWKARLLAARGEADAAAPLLSSVDDIIDDGGFRLHFETLPLLYGALSDDAELDDDEILRQLCVLGRACIERGGGNGVAALLWAAEKLLAGGEATLAHHALRAARRGFELLRDARAAERRAAALDAALAECPPAEPMDQPRDFEGALATLKADPGLERLQPLVSVARAFAMSELTAELIDTARAAAPEDEGLFHFAGQTLLDAGQAVDALVAAPPTTEDGPLLARWLEGRAAAQRGNVDGAVEALAKVAAARPAWTAVAEQLGGLYFEAGRYAEADAVWGAAAATIDGPNAFHWHCLSAATAAGDWERIRALAAAVEFPVPGESGPFEADYGLIRVQYDDDPRPYFAGRIGPLTARVLSLRTPGETQRHGDRVLFHPSIANRDELDDDPEALRLHRVVKTLEAADMIAVDLDGRHPGDAAFTDLRQRLSEAGFFSQIAAGDEYRVVDPETEESHRGMYLLVAARPDELPAVEALFASLEAPGPRVWSLLLELTDRAEEAAAQREVARAWGMI